MNPTLKKQLKDIAPNSIIEIYHKIVSCKQYTIEKWLISRIENKQKIALAKLKNKEKLKCIFFAVDSSSWQYDQVYKLMARHKRFDPLILVCPVVDYGKEHMLETMNECTYYFLSKGYNVERAFNTEDNCYIDVKKRINPDIIFYTSPYPSMVERRYLITNYMDILSVYVPYYINGSNLHSFSSDLLLHNLVWRKYAEYGYDVEIAKSYQRVGGRNVVLTGYPGIEKLIDKNYTPRDRVWKQQCKLLKRIIWAPHHTLEKSPYGHTCFLLYCDFMLELAEKYRDEIQIAFKPHPLLRVKLERLWGKTKTDIYFSKWQNMPNTELHEGKYEDLFLSSDAMIHDSGSFVFEYLFVNKPVMRTIYDVPLEAMFNDLALSCLDQYYKGYSEHDIELFIQNVIRGIDPLKEQRTKFVNDVLMPHGNPSQNIIDDILDSIDNQILFRN